MAKYIFTDKSQANCYYFRLIFIMMNGNPNLFYISALIIVIITFQHYNWEIKIIRRSKDYSYI